VGKSALVEALSTTLRNLPHKSIQTIPTPEALANELSTAIITFQLSKEELFSLLPYQTNDLYLPNLNLIYKIKRIGF